MKETVEHNNRFYGEDLKTESEQLKEWLVIANKEIERLHSIIKEVKELRKHLSFEYYEMGLEVGTNVVIEELDRILVGDTN